MKKAIGKIISLLIVFILLFGFTACQTTTGHENDLQFEKVYAMAVDNGYTGTLDELIEAFKGDSAYTIAVANGYQGSEADWLASLVGAAGAKGEPGKDGLTPHIGTNGNWFIGATDTGISAQGEKGKDGTAGDKGEPGEDGDDGDDGLSAYEIYKKYYPDYTGTEKQWLDDLVNGRLSTTETCTVTFYKKADSGLTVLHAQNAKVGSKISAPDVLPDDGYVITGWYTEAGLINEWSFSDNTVSSNLVLFAKYELIEGLFAGGDGTAVNPYQISNYAQLRHMKIYPDSDFKLVNDLDLSGINHIPLFDAARPFNGSFDGGCFSISNLTVDGYYQFPSLLGVIGEKGSVSALRIRKLDITIPDFDTTAFPLNTSPLSVGALCGLSYGELTDVRVYTGDISGSGLTNDGIAVGGLAGQTASGKITNCETDIDIILDDFTYYQVRRYAYNIGGLIGVANSDVVSCEVYGSIFIDNMYNSDGSTTIGSYSGVSVGGMIGLYNTLKSVQPENVLIDDCFITVDISVNCPSHVAGLVGFISTSSVVTVKDSYALGEIAHGGAVSGFIQIFDAGTGSEINNCVAGVDILSAASASGFVGITQSDGSGLTLIKDGQRVGNGAIEINGCIAGGDIRGTTACGFAYSLEYTDIYNSSFTGNVTASSAAFGFCRKLSESSVDNCSAGGNITGGSQAAGFALQVVSSSEVKRSYFQGTVTGGSSMSVGFIHAINSSTVRECFAAGKVISSEPGAIVSGFIGVVLATAVSVENCYSVCDIYLNGTAESVYRRVGGFIGQMAISSSGNVLISNSYYAGEIQGTCNDSARIGGFVGDITGTKFSIENCHWYSCKDCLATDAVSRLSSSGAEAPAITKYTDITQMYLLADTLNGSSQNPVWINVAGRTPQLSFY